jgi:RNA polymerase sigma-70 factor (ECF subfamily)
MPFDGSVIRIEAALAADGRPRESRRLVELKRRIEELFDELREPLFRYLLSLSATAAEADELIQETFLRAFDQLRQGAKIDAPRAWVFRVAHNLAVNQLKVRRRTALLDPDAWTRLIAMNRDPSLGPEELLLEKEKMARLDAAIAALTPTQRHCINLRAEGFRYREIGEILNLPISTVADTLKRAIETLMKDADG